MALLDRIRIHKCVYWRPSGFDEYGDQAFDIPEELDVRWDEKQEHAIDETGKPTLYMATIISAVGLEKGGYLLRGEKSQLEQPLPPPQEARRIQATEQADTIRGNVSYHFSRV